MYRVLKAFKRRKHKSRILRIFYKGELNLNERCHFIKIKNEEENIKNEEIFKLKTLKRKGWVIRNITDKETGKIYYIEPVKSSLFHSKGYMHDVIDQIYYWQDCSKLANNNGDTYNGERNNDILEGIKLLKVASLAECELTDDGKLKVNTTMKDIKDKVKKIENIQSNK